MNIFESIISPFIFLIKQIFLLSFEITGNYGTSIILLSFSVSLILLPVFILIEKAKKKDDAVKMKMKPLVDEIKRCYKGQERYYYLRTLNRQHNYNPIRALIPTLSLVLQIPFFIAAYQFLEHFEPLKNISFLFINDLAEPDALFGTVNILPILMTLVNLLTAYFYTRNGNTSERKQMVIVAALFLVLLFKLPAGLVLYWTMNNVFSFFRLFITNPEVFKKQVRKKTVNQSSSLQIIPRFKSMLPKLKVSFLLISGLVLLLQLNWALNNDFNQFGIRILGSFGIGLLVPVLIFTICLLHNIGEQKPIYGIRSYYEEYAGAFKPMFLIISSLAIISQISWALQFNFDDFALRLIGSIIAGALVTLFLALLVLYFEDHISFTNLKFNLKPSFNSGFYTALLIIITAVLFYSQINWAIIKNDYNSLVPRLLFVLIFSWGLGLILNLIESVFSNKNEINLKEFKLFVKSKSRLIVTIFLSSLIFLLLLQLNWAIQHDFSDIYLRIFVSFIVNIVFTFGIILFLWFTQLFNWLLVWLTKSQTFFSLFFISLYFHFASIYYYTGFNEQLSTWAFIFGISGLVSGIINYNRVKREIPVWLKYPSLILIGAIIIIQIINTWGLVSGKEILLNLFPYARFTNVYSVQINIYLLIILVVLSFFSFEKKSKQHNLNIKWSWWIHVFSSLYLIGFIFLWNPLSVFSTYPDNFEFPAIEILKNNINLFALTFFGGILLFYILPKRIKKTWLYLILIITFTGFVHNTLLPIKMGTLIESKFLNQNNLAQPVIKYFLEILLFLGSVFFIKWTFHKKYFKQIGITLIILNVVLISQSLIASASTGVFYSKPKVLKDLSRSISFSKNHKNVVYVLLDMFHGWNVGEIMNENPELKEEFEGFVWYPNTISISSTTAGTIPAMFGGYDKTIDKLNLIPEITFEEKMTNVSTEFYNKIKSYNYRFTSSKHIYSKIDKNNFDAFIPSWDDSWNQWNSELNIGVSMEIGYKLLWENATFFTSPLFLKPVVYNKGNWFHGEVATNENTNAAKPYNVLRVLPYISHNTSDKPNFIYLHSWSSHRPWYYIDNNGLLETTETPYKNNEWIINTLAKWIQWMKKNEVYDNTKIIFLSDHGPHWRSELNKESAGNMPIIDNPELDLKEEYYMGMFPLMLVKDYNQKGPIKTDNSFMSNVDAYYMAFDEEIPKTYTSDNKRILPFSIVYWERKLWLKNNVYITAQGTVKENVFDLNNWVKTK